MPKAARQAVGPAYLLMCLILGGSAQGIFFNLLLQLVGLAIIAWAAAAPAEGPLLRSARQLLWLIIATLLIVALQLVPLSPSVWPNLGGRGAVAEGYPVLGTAIPSMPVSLAPFATFATVVTIIPALAMFCAIVRLKAYQYSWLALALLAGICNFIPGRIRAGSMEGFAAFSAAIVVPFALAIL